MNTITFSTKSQAAIFKYEVVGQLSDGRWENTRPYGHYRDWSSAEVKVGGVVGTTGYFTKRNYSLISLSAPELADITLRMRAYAAMAMITDKPEWIREAKNLARAGSFQARVEELAERLRQAPNSSTPNGSTLLLLNEMGSHMADCFFRNFRRYDRTSLRRDLVKMMAIMKQRIMTPVAPAPVAPSTPVPTFLPRPVVLPPTRPAILEDATVIEDFQPDYETEADITFSSSSYEDVNVAIFA